MQIFFSSLHALEQYTFSVDNIPQDDACQFCAAENQWVSHGYVYKQRSMMKREVVGKRLLCGKRYGKQGCGRTRQIYLHSIIPRRRYNLSVLALFIGLLLQGVGVVKSYQQATNRQCSDHRHAWRWINNLHSRIGWFRSLFAKPLYSLLNIPHRSRRLRILLRTLKDLLSASENLLNFQQIYQSAFF